MVLEHLIFFAKYIYFINIFFVVVIIFFERKKPVYSLFWITVLVLTSYIGFVSYLMFGLSFRKKRLSKKFYMRNIFRYTTPSENNEAKKLEKWEQMIQYLEFTGKNRLTFSNNIKIFTDGKKLFHDMKDELKKASSYIHMEYFIFDNDSLGKEFFSILKEKAKSGVEVKLILDGVGCRKLPLKKIEELRNSKIDVLVFFPSYFPFINLRANYRTHRKICIVDAKTGYIGGFNIGNAYIGKGSLGNWRDTHIKLNGEVLNELQKEFFSSWDFIKNQKFFSFGKKTRSRHDEKRYFPEKQKIGNSSIQIVGSAPDYEFHLIRDAILHMITKAKKYIYIQTPYFIPDDNIFEALKIASLSGVSIKIMIPNKPDHLMVYWATHSYVGEMITMGVKFYSYKNGFLHSKVVIVDDEVATVGSSNFDYRSFYQNFEINAFIYDSDTVKKLKATFIEDLADSPSITKEIYHNRKLLVKFKESISRLFSPIL
ncbi:cardiolipin synthase [uncultured Ilyobacter sp.]|uniref:cardiolipin synthase n=1 Tax=uncultured Ilyobacter sp. TaxID=544433 RepID=UPI0029C03DDA|nr:cardiolipin synthase [uncultured Ilyobacter sp.]